MMNNDLISRSGLGVDFCNPDVFENKAYAEGWNSLIKIIKEAPAVDAESVRHGRWVETKNGFHCSNCKKKPGVHPTRRGAYLSDYCPRCGAKMRGDEDATN